MALYVPPHFVTADRDALRDVMRTYSFATLVTPHGSEPMISHVPLVFVDDGSEHGALVGHFARANPHAAVAGAAESIAIFHGPHAYVSPSWYGEPAKMVPTWNYIVVHAHGTLEPTDAEGALALLVDTYEASRESPWSFAMSDPQRGAMLRAIWAFRMPIARLVGKVKLSQNRTPADRERVAAALREEPFAEARATADAMARLPK